MNMVTTWTNIRNYKTKYEMLTDGQMKNRLINVKAWTEMVHTEQVYFWTGSWKQPDNIKLKIKSCPNFV